MNIKIPFKKKHRLYVIWNNMMQRCYNKNSSSYHNYGKRGIKVCQEWHNIENFIKDMDTSYAKGLSIDRIDTNKHYSIENCRWTTKEIQQRNTRCIYAHNTSGYRGVCWHKILNKWNVKISVNNKRIHIGYFDTALDGAKAYNDYVIKNNLEHTLNII